MRFLKTLLSTSLVVFSSSAFAQEWIEFPYDSVLTVSIPPEYKTIDTIGMHFLYARLGDSGIVLSCLPDDPKKPFDIQNQSDLEKHYKEVRTGVMNSQKGKLIRQETVKSGSIVVDRFSFTSGDVAVTNKQWNCALIYICHKTYSLSFIEEDALSLNAPERNRLFSSLRFRKGLSFKDQLSIQSSGSNAYDTGYRIGQVIGFILVLAVVVTVIILIARGIRSITRRRKANS